MGKGVKILHPDLVNLYACTVGQEARIGAFVEIQKNATIGIRCVCEGVTIEDEVFVGHGVMFIDNVYPQGTTQGHLQVDGDWKVIPTVVKCGASIGSRAVIMGGVRIGTAALVGAGAVVTHSVEDYAIVVGVPARRVGDVRDRKKVQAAASENIAK